MGNSDETTKDKAEIARQKRKIYMQEYYKKNKESIQEQRRIKNEQTRDEQNAAARERYANDPEYRESRIKAWHKQMDTQKERYEADPEYRKVIDKRKELRKEKFDKEYFSKARKKSYLKRGEAVNAEKKERYANDPEYREARMKTYRKSLEKRLSQKKEELSKTEMLGRLQSVKSDASRDGKDVYLNNEVRYILGLGHNDFYKVIKLRQLTAEKIGKHYVITEADLLIYIDGEQ